jgi:hypothetical protein
MKNTYFIPALMLAISLGILGMFVASTNRALGRQTAAFKESENALGALTRTLALRRSSLAALSTAASPANAFVSAWESSLRSVRDDSAILSDFSKFGNEATISVQGRKSGTSEYTWRAKPQRVRFAEATGVSSEFYRLANWLGDMERNWPLARFDLIAFEQKGGSLQLAVRLAYPSFLIEREAAK